MRVSLTPLFRHDAEWDEAEDEFECLNLHVTVPVGVKAGDEVPVLVWIYGGSYVATVPGAASGVCGQ